MRNRNLIHKKLELLKSTLTTLRHIVNTQQPIESYRVNIGKALATVEDLEDMVEAEPMSPTELNKV